LDKYLQGPPEFLVTPLLVEPVCLISHGRFEEAVRAGLTIDIVFESAKEESRL